MNKSKKVAKFIFIGLFIFASTFSILSAEEDQGCCSWHGGVGGCDLCTGRLICKDGQFSPTCTCQKDISTCPPPPTCSTCQLENKELKEMVQVLKTEQKELKDNLSNEIENQKQNCENQMTEIQNKQISSQERINNLNSKMGLLKKSYTDMLFASVGLFVVMVFANALWYLTKHK